MAEEQAEANTSDEQSVPVERLVRHDSEEKLKAVLSSIHRVAWSSGN